MITGLRFADSSAGVKVNTLTTARLDGLVFTGHTSPAISIYESAVLTVNNSVFINNTTPQNGAAINIYQGNAIITNSTFRENHAQGYGGAIAVFSGNLKIINSLFAGNTAGESGGAIHAAFAGTTILNTTFSGNNASRGGALYFSRGLHHLTHLTVTENSAGIEGGGINGHQAFVHLNNSVITGNNAPSIPNTINATSAANNIIGGDAGLNPLGDYGGATQTHSLKCVSAALNAGNNALSVDPDNGNPLTTDQRDFPRNFGGTVDIGAFEQTSSMVTNASDNINTPGSLRKAITDEMPGGVIKFDPAFFATPRTIALGGALTINKPLGVCGPGPDKLTLDANHSSRVIYLANSVIVFNGMTLTRGRANSQNDPDHQSGHALYTNSADISASNLVISSSGADDSFGGCILNRSLMTLTDSVVTGCSAAGGNGGAIYNLSTMNIIRSLISDSTAHSGGGIVNLRNLTIRNSTINNNHAVRTTNAVNSPAGGGIINFGDLKLYDSTISSNGAQTGGGLYNRPGTDLNGYADIRNSTFFNNSVRLSDNGLPADGGAIYGDGNHTGGLTATIELHHVTISKNHARDTTGGVYKRQAANNTNHVNISNSIVAGNTDGSGMPDANGVFISYGYNLIGNTSGNVWAANSPNLNGNITNPSGGARLAPLSNYGGSTQTLALLSDSPAINAGNPSTLYANDQRGALRPIGGRADIGAFERNITFDQDSLPSGSNMQYYHQQLSVTRHANLIDVNSLKETVLENIAAAQFAVVPAAGQQLPPGVSLSSSGELAGTPTTPGIYTFTVKATDTDGMTGVQEFTVQIFPVLAASVSVSGRAGTAYGRGIAGAAVILTDLHGNTRAVVTNSFGYFRFDGVTAGQTYVVTASSREYQFAQQFVTVTDDVTDLTLTALP